MMGIIDEFIWWNKKEFTFSYTFSILVTVFEVGAAAVVFDGVS